MVIKKKFVFTIRFDMKKDKKKGNHEPLVSFRRPRSAEQAQFLSVFRSDGGKRESESHARGRVKKKKSHKKTPVPLCTPR